MKKHFEIIDHNAFIVWEFKYPDNNILMLIGTLYWNYKDMEDYIEFGSPLTDLKEFDDKKELAREVLIRKYKHQFITQ